LPEFITVYNNKDDFLKNFKEVLQGKDVVKSNFSLNGIEINEDFDITDLFT
jgi:hypothetical protein